MRYSSARPGVALLAACALIIQAPGPGCWAASVRVLARPAAAGAPALGGAWALRLGPGPSLQTYAAGLRLPGLAAPSAPAVLEAPQVSVGRLSLRPEPALGSPVVLAVAPAAEGPVQAAAPAGEAAPQAPLQTRLETAAQEGLRKGETAPILSRIFDGSDIRTGGAGLAQPAAEAPEEPRPSGLARGEAETGPLLAEPAPPAPARSRLAMLRELVFGEPEIAPLLKPYRLQMNAARAMLITKAVLSTALAYSIGAAVDAAIAHALPATGLWLGTVAGLFVAKAVTQRFYTVTAGNLRIRVRRDVRLRLFAGLTGLSDAGEDPGRLAARLTADVTRVTVKNVTIPIQVPHLFIQFALATALVVKASPLMAGVILGSLPLLGWLAWRYGRRSAELQERAATQNAALTHAGAELLAGAPLPDDRRDPAVARYGDMARRFEKTMREFIGLGANFDAAREFLQAACTEILVLGVGLVSFVLTGAPSVGQIMSLRGYAKDLRGAVDGLVDVYTDGKDAEGGTRRILDLLRRAPAPRP